ncbi:MAG: hypothetical protein QXJ75_04700 [Candidatus Bathyarchaeia archaeon]
MSVTVKKIEALVEQLTKEINHPLRYAVDTHGISVFVHGVEGHIMRVYHAKTKIELWFLLGHRGRALGHLGIFPAQWKGWYTMDITDDTKLGAIKSLLMEAVLFSKECSCKI